MEKSAGNIRVWRQLHPQIYVHWESIFAYIIIGWHRKKYISKLPVLYNWKQILTFHELATENMADIWLTFISAGKVENNEKLLKKAKLDIISAVKSGSDNTN